MKFQFLVENTMNNTLGTVSKFCPSVSMYFCIVAKISRYCAYRIVINMVVGGKVVTLKSIEESSHIVMQETPMQEEDPGWYS
ncbi:hypothetical protein glysoja_043363 [Glycine soja]|uniref:Uncharacterized protein n=1 Tax=Glycine soja TaxID=3848 RepID=A0A0B2SMU5_GLYSO|nr:hypothetical protein glysoja_043363 [Glycine soja]